MKSLVCFLLSLRICCGFVGTSSAEDHCAPHWVKHAYNVFVIVFQFKDLCFFIFIMLEVFRCDLIFIMLEAFRCDLQQQQKSPSQRSQIG